MTTRLDGISVRLAAPVLRAAMLPLLLVGIAVPAWAHSPSLGVILPRGAQRGTEVEVRFIGERLADAQEILFTRTGVEVVRFIEPKDPKEKEREARVLLKIAPDAPLGPRAAYIRTLSGISTVQLFTVGALKEIQEPEPNADRAAAPKVELNTTINGVVDGEDVDNYSFEAQAGQRLNFEVEGLRLASSRLDSSLTLFDPSGREVAAQDDTPLLGQDCAIGYTAKEAGVYTIQIHEASYGGGGNFYYRLHMGTFPRPVGVFPPGGKPGEVIQAKWMGEPQLTDGPATLPQELGMNGLFPEVGGLIPPSEVPVRISNLDNFIEVEPNNAIDKATTITLPGAANGIITESGDLDYYKFTGKKGQVFDFQLYGRRLRSPLDSVLYITNAGGGVLAGDDDAARVDSFLRFTIPDDGVYGAFVKDHLNNGSPQHFYRLEITPVEPGLDLVTYIPGRLDMSPMYVALGNRNAMMLSVRRKDMGGAMKLVAENLPPGMHMEVEDVADGIGDVPVVFSADETTTASGKLVDLAGRPADENVKVTGHINQTVELVRIENNVPVMTHQQKEVPLVVTERYPFKIEIIEPKVPMVQNGVMNLLVKATRDEGYKNPIDIRLLWNPPGIGSGTARIEEGKTTATLPLNAASNAPVRDWKIVVIGSAGVVNAGVEVSTQLAKLSVSAPWIGLAFDKARTEQGTQVPMTVKCTTAHEFQGEATVELVGLPNKVSAPVQKMTKDVAEIKYQIDVPKEAPAGKFDGVFARATIMDQGEPIVHQIGGAELRIDVPLPPPADQPPPPPGQAAPPPKPKEGPVRGARKLADGIAPFKRTE